MYDIFNLVVLQSKCLKFYNWCSMIESFKDRAEGKCEKRISKLGTIVVHSGYEDPEEMVKWLCDIRADNIVRARIKLIMILKTGIIQLVIYFIFISIFVV